ncbi:MAG: hypothetical protein KJ072_20410 [Verrucomicrobia bacterium]|nr:hypothetical protein [Verrucomicrobiota bacterium]
MAIFYALGDALVSHDELRAKAAHGKLQQFHQEILSGSKTARLDFKFGMATAKNLVKPKTTSTGGIIQPREIEIGKPLTVQLRHVYTGNKAKGFWGDKDMLVVSAMKSLATYDAAPRAINYLVRKATNNRNFRTPDATDAGTPLICYSPALAQSSSVVTVEVMFHGFPKETFDAVAQAFSMAAGLPVFAPASAYLVDDEKRAYDGPHCYAVISLDGRANTDFEQFTPVAASAAQFDRFYNITDGSSQVLGQLVEGLKLYNDMTFRERAAKAKQRLQALEAQGVARTDPEYQEGLAQYHAYVANIDNQVLKPRD